MKQLLYNSLFCLLFNTWLLILPIIFFLISLHWQNAQILDLFLWIYLIFLLSSPILTFLVAFRTASQFHDYQRWFAPFLICFIAYLPLWVISIQVNALWGLREYAQVLLIPLGLGSLDLLLLSIIPLLRTKHARRL